MHVGWPYVQKVGLGLRWHRRAPVGSTHRLVGRAEPATGERRWGGYEGAIGAPAPVDGAWSQGGQGESVVGGA